MSVFLSNAFTDPNDPWYYVIGVLFLLMIFGALAAYIIISGKNKKKSEDPDKSVNENGAADADKVDRDSTDEAVNADGSVAENEKDNKIE